MGKAGRSDPSRATAPHLAPPASGRRPGSGIDPSRLGRPQPLLPAGLVTAVQLQELLGIDRSTVYRMAADGRLPAIKVGRQWRFPADRIRSLLQPLGVARTASSAEPVHPGAGPPGASVVRGVAGPGAPADPVVAGPGAPVDLGVAGPVLEVAGLLLGVMILVADLDGRPLTPVVNPCPWFEERSGDPDVMRACSTKWRALARAVDFTPRFRVGQLGVECAHAFIRSGNELVGMVLAGGIAPAAAQTPGLYRLTEDERRRVLTALPRIAAALSRVPAR